jgi:hypothetical protein
LNFVPPYIKVLKENGNSFKHKLRYTKTTTQLSDRKISIKHAVDLIHSIFQVIRPNESTNTQFFHGMKKLEALLVVADDLFLSS